MADDEYEYEIHRLPKHPHGAKLIGRYKNKTFARNKVDKLDNEYGAYAHVVKPVKKEHEASHWGDGKGNPNGGKR